MSEWVSLCSYPTLAEVMREHFEHNWTESECVAVVNESKDRCPEYTTTTQRGGFIRWYAAKKAKETNV